MKRLFTLFAAIITITCMYATPQQPVRNPKKFQPDRKFERTISSRMGVKPTFGNPAKATGIHAIPMHKSNKAAEMIESPYDEWAIQDYGSDLWFNAIDLQKENWFYFDVYASLYSLQMGKEYTLSDMDPQYTYVQDITTFEKDFVTEVKFIPADYGKPIPGFEAWCTTVSGASYHVFYKAPEVPEELTEVQVGQLTTVGLKDLTATQGLFQITGANDFFDFGITVKSQGQIEGNYTLDDIHGLNMYTYINDGLEDVNLYDAELNVTKLTRDNDYHFEAKLYGYNGKLYIITGDYIQPTVEKTVDITATNLTIDDSAFDLYKEYAGYGVATLAASNEDYFITGYLYSYGDLPGHYRDDQRSAQYWEITGPDGETTEVFSANFDLILADNTWTIKGSVLGWNNIQYNLNLSGEYTEPIDYDVTEGDVDVTYTLDDIEEFEVNTDEGYAYLSAASVERADTWFTFIYIQSDGLLPGTYPITSTYEAGTVQAGDIYNGDIYPTMYATTTDDGYLVDLWFCRTGTVTVGYDHQGNIQMECNAVNTHDVHIHVKVNMPDTQGITTIASTPSSEIYNLSGMRISRRHNLKPGVYILSGKKVVY